MKKCSKCKYEKIDSSFSIKKNGKLESWCKQCKNEKKKIDRIEFRKENPRLKRIKSDYLTSEGLIICSKCRTPKEKNNFQNEKAGWCKECRAKLESERRIKNGIKKRNFSEVNNDLKKCPSCNQFLPFNLFYKSELSKSGFSSFCKACIKDRFYNKEKSVLLTRKYRQENRATYLASHRIHQFERKTKIKVTTDETITKDFIKGIYSEEFCYYCESFTEKEKRTLDHKVPLSKGGCHTASNLVMACWTCNCSKRDLSEHEFKERLIKNG